MAASGVCAVCESEALLRCGGCKIVFYCSKEHQKQHWRLHKKLCKELVANETKLRITMENLANVRKELEGASKNAEEARNKAELASQNVQMLFNEKEEAEKEMGKASSECDANFLSTLQGLKEEGFEVGPRP